MSCKRPISLVILCSALSTFAWYGEGHVIICRAALRCLPAEMPLFFRQGEATVSQCSIDPDLQRNKALPALASASGPEHFLDLELLKGASLPPDRYGFIRLCCSMKLDPKTVGLLPYAIAENTERLVLAFAEYRAWPSDRVIRQKCLIYAGVLSHYTADACQPLHVTVHYNGKVGPDGVSPKSGIHDKMDGLIERLRLSPDTLAFGVKADSLDGLMGAITEEIARSSGLVDSVYALERALSFGKDMPAPPPVAAFAKARGREAARFTASALLAAWRLSAGVRMKEWTVKIRSRSAPRP